jgi:hypothetical protein
MRQMAQLLTENINVLAEAGRVQMLENTAIKAQLATLTAAAVECERSPSPSPFIASGAAPSAATIAPPASRRLARRGSSDSSQEATGMRTASLAGQRMQLSFFCF